MTVGSKGVVLVINAGGFNMTGAKVTLLASPGGLKRVSARGPALRLTPCVVAANGLTASYTTTGTDFQASGPWLLQLEVVTAAGQTITSAPKPFYVNPLLVTA